MNDENWKDGQPNDYFGQGQDYGMMLQSDGGKWDDHKCCLKNPAMLQQSAGTCKGSTPAYCLHPGPDGRGGSRCLLGHVVKELPADGVQSCGKACRLEPRCQTN